MKYQRPKLYPIDKAFPAYAACVSGNEATRTTSCLTGVSAENSACVQGVHPEFSCVSGTLPGTDCISGSANSEW